MCASHSTDTYFVDQKKKRCFIYIERLFLERASKPNQNYVLTDSEKQDGVDFEAVIEITMMLTISCRVTHYCVI